MITLVNFANDSFKKQQKWNSFSAKVLGRIDCIFEYNEKDIDKDYLSLNKESLKYEKRGFGNYFWKPYIIDKALNRINDGEYLMYADSGSFFLKSVNPLIQHMEKQKKDVLCFRLPLIEKQWTKRDAFILMECDESKYADTEQILSGFIILRKSKKSVDFIRKFKEKSSDSRILSDDPNVMGKENYPDYLEHRHDQSVLSLLSKKEKGILIEGDLSDYGWFPYRYTDSKTQDRLYNRTSLDVSRNKFKGTLLCNRGRDPFKYFIKYLIRRFFLFFGYKK